MQEMILYPHFRNNRPELNPLELCGLFLLDRPAQVPVAAFRIISDDQESTFVVEPEQHCDIALLLLLFMDRTGRPTYTVTPAMKNEICVYVGNDAVKQAASPDTKHQALRALLGDRVTVELVLQPNYGEYLATGRNVTEVIEVAWARRESLTAQSPEPFLRRALIMLHSALDSDALMAATMHDESFVNWADTWSERILELRNCLLPELQTA